MTETGKFVVGWIVLILLVATFITSVVGLNTLVDSKERAACILISCTSILSIILLSNII